MTFPTVAILNYGSGNIQSISQALKNLDISSLIISDPSSYLCSDFTHIILPGVGKFDSCRQQLDSSGLFPLLVDTYSSGSVPILGICIGMHLLASSSEEGSLSGLNFIPGKVQHFSNIGASPCPHMGWNSVTYLESNNPLDLPSNSYYYFIHSFYYCPSDESTVMGISHYNSDFCSVISSDQVFGVQFHPEKSHHFGLSLLQSFSNFKC